MGLKQKRKALKLTQAEMAEKFGLTRQTYQNYENGKTEPTLYLASQLALFFNCTVADLFDLPEVPVPLSECEAELLATFADLNKIDRVKLIDYARDLSSAKLHAKGKASCSSASHRVDAAIDQGASTENRLKAIRKRAGQTQDQAALGLGIPLSTYRSYEQGQRDIRSSLIVRLCEYFDVSANELLGVALIEERCRDCIHCAQRHMKPNMNTGGDYVCLVLGSLIPDCFIGKKMCSGLYYDSMSAGHTEPTIA